MTPVALALPTAAAALAAAGWRPIAMAPEGAGDLRVADARIMGECRGRRAPWHGSGWCDALTHREIWPTHWRPLEE